MGGSQKKCGQTTGEDKSQMFCDDFVAVKETTAGL